MAFYPLPGAAGPAADPYGILAACGAAGGGLGPDFAGQLLETLALGVVLPALVASEGARPGDTCPDCLCPLVVREMEYECPDCHAVRAAADLGEVLPVSTPSEPGAGALRGRLRVVGVDAGWYQPDLDRTNPAENNETQKKTTYAELKRLNEEYRGRGGNPFPLDVLNDVAENYNVVQQTSVKRSMMKRSIISALLFHCCLSRGFARTKAEVAEFAKLPNHGIARGDDFLRAIHEDKGLDLDMNRPRLDPNIATTFAQLDLDGAAYAPLREAVAAVVRLAGDSYVGTQSVPRSQVIAAACEVLVRGRALLRRIRPGVPPVTVADVVEKCRIRKHTVVRFRKELADYHSLFEGVYAAHGLLAVRPEEVEARLAEQEAADGGA